MRNWSVLLLALLYACGGDDEPTSTAPATNLVHSGQSIQAAINAAPPNSVIMVEPGTYHESSTATNGLTITKDGIQLVALSTPGHPVVIENTGGQKNGIWVSPADSVGTTDTEHPPCGVNGHTIKDFTLTGFTVRGFDQFGVYLACNDGYTLRQNLSDGNQVYGLFPVRSQNGMVANNEARNTPSDAAIYIGQSDHITVTGNTSHDSLIGIEIENTSNATVTQNETFNDTVGIITDVLPGLQKKDQVNVVIMQNNVHDNNRANSGEPGDLTSAIPTGSGILILSGVMTTVQNNTVSNNGFTGVAVASYCTGLMLLGESCGTLDISPDPQTVRVVGNQLTNNGTQPPDDPILGSLSADLIWDNTGNGNCWGGNTPTATMKTLHGHVLPVCQ